MKNETIKISKELFNKALNNSLTPEEDNLFNLWLKDNHKHWDYFKKAVQYNKLDNEKDYDYAKPFNEFKKRIHKKRTINWFIAVASVILVLGILSIFVVDIDTNNNFKSLKYSDKIFKDNGIITLELSSGEKINIEKKESIKEIGGNLISVKNNELSYKNISDNLAIEKYNTVYVPRGNDCKLILSDGTKVWLNAESTIKYPIQFLGANRKVYITGEAYFEVAHNKKKPFVVYAENNKIKVLGTKFNINTYKKDIIYTTLIEGKVEVSQNNIAKILKPKQQIHFNKNKAIVNFINVENIIDWKSGFFNFEENRLEDIMDELSRWYDLKVFYFNNEIKNLKFTGYLNRNKELNSLLNLFEMTRSVKFYISDNTILLKPY